MISTQLIPGKDYIGVGVGALIINHEGKIFISQRGPKARNERNKWEIPGGKLDLSVISKSDIKYLDEHWSEL